MWAKFAYMQIYSHMQICPCESSLSKNNSVFECFVASLKQTCVSKLSDWEEAQPRSLLTNTNSTVLALNISNAMRTRCFCYVQKTGSPSHNLFVVKHFKKCNPPEFKFYLGKFSNEKFPIWCYRNDPKLLGQIGLGKQCRLRSVWSGSTLFAMSSASFRSITVR